jgi:hypothetical protein
VRAAALREQCQKKDFVNVFNAASQFNARHHGHAVRFTFFLKFRKAGKGMMIGDPQNMKLLSFCFGDYCRDTVLMLRKTMRGRRMDMEVTTEDRHDYFS